MTNCKNDKTKLQMIGSCMVSHVVVNLMVAYYKISFSVTIKGVVTCNNSQLVHFYLLSYCFRNY
jgi:hypothetical protein